MHLLETCDWNWTQRRMLNVSAIAELAHRARFSFIYARPSFEKFEKILPILNLPGADEKNTFLPDSTEECEDFFFRFGIFLCMLEHSAEAFG